MANFLIQRRRRAQPDGERRRGHQAKGETRCEDPDRVRLMGFPASPRFAVPQAPEYPMGIPDGPEFGGLLATGANAESL